MLFMTSCEDGDIGSASENGIDGIDGTDGIQGTDGIGFEELTQYGSINLTLEGTNPNDDTSFTDATEFRFTLSPVEHSLFEINTDLEFRLARSFDTAKTINVNIVGIVTNPGEANEELTFVLQIAGLNIVAEDLAFFIINDTFDTAGDPAMTGIPDVSITNYSFNNETNQLAFSFSFNISGSNNSTGKDLAVSGEVDVLVLQPVTP